MWFGKKVFEIASVLALAVTAFAADVEPLHFNGVGESHEVQQSYWDNLMRYKMFGTNGITFEGQNVRVTDKVGWFGTAKGDFLLKNNKHVVGGPVLIGGNIQFTSGDGEENFTSGPTRVTGGVFTQNFNPTNSFTGPVCVAGDVSQKFREAVPAANQYFGTNGYANCPKTVPTIDPTLAIPSYKGSTTANHSNVYADKQVVVTIDVPVGSETYDLVISDITLTNGAQLFVRMPKGGRLTRIFVTGQLKVGPQCVIQVQYQEDDGSYTTVSNDLYAGDLLFYMMNDFDLQARDSSYSLQGTYISEKTIYVRQHLTLAGQLLANNLIVDADFDGTKFNYVPFDAPKFSAKSWGTVYEGVEYEGVAQALTVTLNKTPKTDVTFRYCFIANGDAEAGMEADNFTASEADLDVSKMNLCRNDSWGHAAFTAEDSVLAKPITVYVKDDGILENEEVFKIVIDSLQGAVASDSNTSRRDTFEIKIIDDDKTPVCHDTTIVVKEDNALTFAGAFPAFQHNGVDPLNVAFGAQILTVPTNPIFIGNDMVTPYEKRPEAVPSYLFGDMVYKNALNENNSTAGGVHYDSLTFAIELRKGVRSEPCTMYIDVTPVNDPPELKDTTIYVRENAPVDTSLLTLVGFDVDGDNLTYSIDSGDVTLFGLRGMAFDDLYLKGALDYEKSNKHVLKVVVSDGEWSDEAHVTIIVKDENEPPKFDESEYKFIVREHAKLDSVFGEIHATDVDAADQNKLKYSFKDITGGNSNGESVFELLTINDNNGYFVTKDSIHLDYETQQSYKLRAYVTDGKDLQDSVIVDIIVDDINEKPAFAVELDSVSIPEITSNGNLLTVEFSDPDVKSILEKTGYHETHLYLNPCEVGSCNLPSKIYENEAVTEIFSVNDAGVISLKKASALNYETDSIYYLMIIVKDNITDPNNSLSDTMVVKVKITNVNEPPAFEFERYDFDVDEHAKTRVQLGKVVATDKDIGTVLSYSFSNGKTVDPTGSFEIDASSGVIETLKSFNYEANSGKDSVRTLSVVVSDNDAENPLTATTKVVVKINDINETPWAESVTFHVDEDAGAGHVLGTVAGHDLDLYNTTFHTYTFAWADLSEEGTDLFKIDASGVVSLITKGVLDHEGVQSYGIHVRITDKGGLDSIALVTIDVDDVNEPPVLRDTTLEIHESQMPSNTEAIVSLRDLSWDPESPVSRLKYYIISGNDDDKFSLNATSGRLTLDKKLNYEYQSQYIIKVYAVDPGELKDTATITINVIDDNDPPVFVSNDFVVNEHNPENLFVGKLEANDEDSNLNFKNLKYKLLDDPSYLFSVNPDGKIVVHDADVLDYETQNEYVIKVRVWDAGGLADTMDVLIMVDDINEKPVINDTTVHVKEHVDARVITKLGVFDFDKGQRHTFSLLESSDTIQVNSDGSIATLMPLNYEDVQKYTIKVVVTDNGTYPDSLKYLMDTATVTIIVDDVNEPPTVPDQKYSILETSGAGTFVGLVKDAKDNDVLNTAFHTLSYSIIDSTEGAADLFVIDPSTGRISVKEDDSFDYETKGKVYYLKLIVADGGKPSLKDTATITINIDDVPEKPHFDESSYKFTIKENSPEGTEVGSVSASDKDEDEVLHYFLRESSGKFVMDEFSGIIRVAKNAKLDYETKAEYTGRVTVKDKSGLTDEAEVTINLTDVDEMPVFENPKRFSISEIDTAGTLVGTLNSSDLDTAKIFKQHRFDVVGGDSALFSMTGDGKIYLNQVLDYEENLKKGKTIFKLAIKLIDVYDEGKTDTLFVIDTVLISLTNVNENPYVTTKEMSVKENTASGFLVGLLDAEDPDGVTTFTFTLHRTSSDFEVEPSGAVYVKKGANLDYEVKQNYTISVRVSDAEGGVSEVADVIIHIIDVNEPPTLKDTVITVREDAPVDTIFARIVGTDPDILNPDFSKLTYEMLSKKDTFDILPNGDVRLLRHLDYEADSEYVRIARVYDGEFYDTANVLIKVENVEESTYVDIVKVEDPDSTWDDPHTIYTNNPYKTIDWIMENLLITFDTVLVDGPNVIKRCYKNPTKDFEACDSVVIYYSNKIPTVTIDAEGTGLGAENIYTIVEDVDSTDESVYVNKHKNDIVIIVDDPDVSNKKTKIEVNVNLDTVGVHAKDLETVKALADDFGYKRLDTPSSEVYRNPTNDGKVLEYYADTVAVNGEKVPVKVSYLTDEKGEPLKTAVIDEKGKVDSVEVITVTYTTKVKGKEVLVSYMADAYSGNVLNVSSNGQLTYADETNSSSAGDAIGAYKVSYYEVTAKGDTVTVSYLLDDKGELVTNEDGDIGFTVSYSYTNRYGNTATQSKFMVLDQTGPKVEILSPAKGTKREIVYSNYVFVTWTVNGEKQDTLITQGLDKGLNAIVRFYRDKAGNEASDIVYVVMKGSKDIEIAVEQPVTQISREKVEEYYSAHEPEKGQTFAVSIKNPGTGKEVETLIGGHFKNKEGSGEEPYPGVEDSLHLGPTLSLDIKLPVIKAPSIDNVSAGSISGMATLDDLLNSAGSVSLDGADAEMSEKWDVDEYVEEFCTDEFKDEFQKEKDIKKMNLYNSKIDVRIWVYTNLGGFVNEYKFSQELNNPEFTNEAGVLQMFFEMKPDRNGDVITEDGRLLATGAYVYKVETKLRNELRCSLPPVAGTTNKKGDVTKASEELLKPFGYKRPAQK